MEYLFMGLAVIVIIVALMFFRRLYKTDSNVSPRKINAGFINCPVCNSPLLPGENLRSKVFRSPESADNQLCYIYGCPHCFPVCDSGVKRFCPVCKKIISQDGYLISRMFNKTKSGRPHVIVNGCGNCKKNK